MTCPLAKSFFLFGNQSIVAAATPICMAVTLVEAGVLSLVEVVVAVHRDEGSFVAGDGDVVGASQPISTISNSPG